MLLENGRIGPPSRAVEFSYSKAITWGTNFIFADFNLYLVDTILETIESKAAASATPGR